jgi:hypothetical protein
MKVYLEQLYCWRGLRPAWFATLALVLAFAGGVPGRQARAQGSSVHMTVNFSPRTSPVPGNVICKGQNYDIEVRPVVIVGSGIGPVPLFGAAILSLTRPERGTLNSTTEPSARIVDAGGPAVFTYNAQTIGPETLNFGLAKYMNPTVLRNADYEVIANPRLVDILVSRVFKFDVQECRYTVTMIADWHYSGGGVYLGATADMAQARLERKPDGTFEGTSPFDFEYMASLGICAADYSGYISPTRIVGKIRNDTHELELTFRYGQASSTATFYCPDGGAMVARAEDVLSHLGVSTAKFSQEGGVKAFPLPGQGTGRLTIIVRPETTGTQN